MCLNCKSLINAIDRYIEKADDDLESMLEEEERASPKEMVKRISAIEAFIAAALVSQTEYFISQIKKKKNLKQVMENIEEIKLKDVSLDELKSMFRKEFNDIIEDSADLYIKKTDPELSVSRLSKRTVNWIESWSEKLGDIMKLNSHNEIESILKKGIENGDSIDIFTRNIIDGGIRDEYYKARRVAVTEVLRAHNTARQEAFMQDPSVLEKIWRHTGTHKNDPRENHIDMDGQRVPKDEPFELIGRDGGVYYPMQPCDSGLPPEESINCHCISQPVVSEDILGLPLEERQRLQQEAVDEMDDEWEKELDRKNRAKAGIDNDTAENEKENDIY